MIEKSKQISTKTQKNSKNYFLFGKHSIFAALHNPKRKKFHLIATDKYRNILDQYKKLLKITYVNKFEFSKLLPNDLTHQEIALEVAPLNKMIVEDLILDKKKSLIICLDQVVDPQNIGHLIRLAAAFEADAVINTINNSPGETASMVKAASGAFEITPYIQVTNMSLNINFLKQKDYWCYGMDGNASSTMPNNLPSKLCIILGSEEKGIRKLVKKHCDLIIKIPINKQVESINVASAGAIIMHKFFNHN